MYKHESKEEKKAREKFEKEQKKKLKKDKKYDKHNHSVTQTILNPSHPQYGSQTVRPTWNQHPIDADANDDPNQYIPNVIQNPNQPQSFNTTVPLVRPPNHQWNSQTQGVVPPYGNPTTVPMWTSGGAPPPQNHPPGMFMNPAQVPPSTYQTPYLPQGPNNVPNASSNYGWRMGRPT